MDAYIYDAVRTPKGSTRKNGALRNIEPIELVKQLLDALYARNGQVIDEIEDIILGCVTQIKDQGANIAKTAALYAGLPYSIPGMTINRFCTSGLDAVAIAASKVHSPIHDVIIAGGVESVSRVPMFADEGAWFANKNISEKTKFLHMGLSADIMATLEQQQRTQLDAYAVRSHKRAATATNNQRFHSSLIPVRQNGEMVLESDELIRADTSEEALATLTPSFQAFLSAKQLFFIKEAFPFVTELQHLHHVGNSPSLADGAALLVIGNELAQEKLHKKPIAKIIGVFSVADHPMLLLGGQLAAEKLLEKCQLTIADMDVIEFYEAYASTAVKAMHDWQVNEDTFNPNGGVIASGHALGATGAMMVCTLLDELVHKGGKFGLVTLSGGGGVGTAMIVERMI